MSIILRRHSLAFAFLVCAAAPPATAQARVLITSATEVASTWSYTTETPAANWMQPGFDDTAWAEGAAGFGVTDPHTPPGTVGTAWTTPDLWLRRTVDAPIPLEFETAGLIVRHDEDVELYVGGTLVFSIAGYNTEWTAYDVTEALRAALEPGRNLVAAHVHQTWGGQYLDVGLVLDPERELIVMPRPIDPAERQALREARWSKERAREWYDAQPWPCGFNYIPAFSISYTEMWMPYNFDVEKIDRELALAEEVGFNCLRVVLPFVVWEHDPEAFVKQLESFLEVCRRRGLRVMFTLFDDCAFGSDEALKNPVYGKQPEVLEGWYANGWTPSPGHDLVRDASTWPRLERYVKHVIGAFADDTRVWVWDLYNEPMNGGLGGVSLPLVERVFRWAREVNPSQPLTVGQYNGAAALNELIYENSDVITFHDYGSAEKLKRHIEELQRHGRPLINTEWLNRGYGSRVETCLPIFREDDVGCLHWGLVNGKTQTHLGWGWRPGREEPDAWQHDLFHGDGTPYRSEELELFRKLLSAGREGDREP